METEDLLALQERAQTSGGSNIEVLTGLILAFVRLQIAREIGSREEKRK
jgi:hypothetical protein